MAMPEAAWRSLLETHLANLRSHRAVLDHLASLFNGDGGYPAVVELEAMRGRAERIWEDAVRAGELLENVRGKTPAETPTPSKPRRISSGAEVGRAGTPIAEEDEEEDEVGGLEEDEDVNGARSRRIVVANIPQGTTEKDISQHLRAYRPIRLKHSIRPPKKSEIHIYDLPAQAHTNGLTKIELNTTSIAARATRELDGSRFGSRPEDALIVRRYRDGTLTEKMAKKRHRVSSGQYILPQRESKRQRTGDGPSGDTADVPNNIAVGQQASSPFIFTAGSSMAVEQEPEYEDISAEVKARLAELAARRATTKQKVDGPATGKKRKRLSGASAGDVEAEVLVEEGIKGMMLVDGRPQKRMREGAAEDEEAVEEKVDAERPQNGFPKSKARMRKERRRERQKEVEVDGKADDSPRPMKRSRVGGGREAL